jgi:lipopolysaccharide export system permease protein
VGKTLFRYVLGEVVGVLLLGLLITTFVLAVVQMMDLVDLAFAKGVPATRVLTVFGYMVPAYLELTLPMALLLSIVGAFARLSRDSEMLALRASGLSLPQLVRPLLAFSVLIGVVSFALAAYVSPWANRQLEGTVREMARTRISAAITPGIFSPWVNDMVVYVGSVERRSGQMRHVMLADERDPLNPRTIFAAEGRLTTDDTAGTALFEMNDGTILTDYETPDSFDKTDFQKFELNINVEEDSVPEGAVFMDEPRRMDWEQLLAMRAAQRRAAVPTTDQDVEIHRRIVVGAACLMLPLLGVPLGSQRSRSVRSRGLVIGLVIILIYYFALTAAVTLVDAGVAAPAPAMWTPNLALALIGLWVFRRAATERRLFGSGHQGR